MLEVSMEDILVQSSRSNL